MSESLQRPTSNIEQFIADPANDITPNQAQLDALDNELEVYWRIAISVAEQFATTPPASVDTSTTSAAPTTTAGGTPTSSTDTGASTSSDASTSTSTG